jgi:hypothetical protein
MYYTTIPLVSERANNRRWDASKLRELRKRLDSGTMTVEDIDGVAGDFMDGEIVDLASDWLGNTVSSEPRLSPLSTTETLFSGCPKVIRKVLPRSEVRDARKARPSSCYDWHPQEWYLGCSENYRMRSDAGRDFSYCAESPSVRASAPSGSIWKLCCPVSIVYSDFCFPKFTTLSN